MYIVVTASASSTGFESRQGVSFLVLSTYIEVLLAKINMHCYRKFIFEK
jgi:hypothetical protein